MEKPIDDLDAVRIIVQTLEQFNKTEDRERIFRWAAEKLGMSSTARPLPGGSPSSQPIQTKDKIPYSPATGSDLKTFVAEKNPKTDVHFAAAVAYYYRFEASSDKHKDSINKEDLINAIRIVNRDRLKNPGQTLNNAYKLGLLDKGGERGEYSINMVGENLVAVVLPDGSMPVRSSKSKKRSPKKDKQGKKRAMSTSLRRRAATSKSPRKKSESRQ